MANGYKDTKLDGWKMEEEEMEKWMKNWVLKNQIGIE